MGCKVGVGYAEVGGCGRIVRLGVRKVKGALYVVGYSGMGDAVEL